MKLRRLKPTIRALNPVQPRQGGSAHLRMTGRALQDRRLKLWTEDPHCKGCGALTDYPWGFELDHIVPLSQGGQDDEDNCQVLCVWYDDEGLKQGCHANKTKDEVAGGAQE